MPIAAVALLRKLPSGRASFDYQIPDDLHLEPGHLVEVPFLRQSVRGVVWDLRQTSPVAGLRPISRLLHPLPIVTAWQRTTAQAIHDQTWASWGHILSGAIPLYPRRTITVTAPPHMERQPVSFPPRTQWYRSRPQAENEIMNWLLHTAGPRLVLTPTIEDVERLTARALEQHLPVRAIHRHLGQVAYRQIYEEVRQGTCQIILGTASALLLPFPVEPLIFLDQEEHPSHKSSQQHPRYDLRYIVMSSHRLAAVSTPAPSLWWFNRLQPTPPPPVHGRLLASLDQPSQQFWVSAQFEQVLEDATHEEQKVAVIVPRRGYASVVRCRQCGLSLTCPVCHHPSSLTGRPPEPVRCQFCQHVSAVPSTCPRCGSVEWNFSGLGPERMAEMLGPRLPQALIGTYQLYRQLTGHSVRTIIVAHGDALLNVPDFSSEERAWQYLARLQASNPTSQVMVQTFHPEHDFWQRWRNSDDESWYRAEVQIRHRLHLPPVTDQWLARIPGPNDGRTVERMVQHLQGTFGGKILVSILPPVSGRTTSGQRLLLSSPDQPLQSLLNGPELFPTPWQVETVVTSWLD